MSGSTSAQESGGSQVVEDQHAISLDTSGLDKMSGFPNFTELPPEIRSQIWRHVLFTTCGTEFEASSLFYYKPGCWDTRKISESEPHYDAGDLNNLALEFFHDRLDDIEINVPLLFVNHEARQIAETWILRLNSGEKSSFAPCWTPDQGHTVDTSRTSRGVARNFSPDRDILYIKRSEQFDFLDSGQQRLFESDLLDITVSAGDVCVKRLAMSEWMFLKCADCIHEIFDWYQGVNTLYIVKDLSQNQYLHDNACTSVNDMDEDQVPNQWRLEGISAGTAYRWNRDRLAFDKIEGLCSCPPNVCDLIERVVEKRLSEYLPPYTTLHLEIRPVLAVRKQDVAN